MSRKLWFYTAALVMAVISLAVARGVVVHRRAARFGASSNGKQTTLPNGWRISPAGRQISLQGDLVFKMLFTPDGKNLVVNTGGFHDHDVTVIDVATEKVKSTANVWKDWAGMAIDPATSSLFVSGGGQLGPLFYSGMKNDGASDQATADARKPVIRLSLKDGNLEQQPGISIQNLPETERFVAGIAVAPRGVLYVVNTQTDSVYRLSGDGYGTVISTKVEYRPYGVAISPDAQTVAVSNWGAESVSILDAKTLQSKSLIKVGNHPNELVYGKDGRLWVACSGTNSVSVIAKNQVIETIKTSIDPTDPVGSTPDGLALAPDGKTLYVANADNNDVAVIDVSDKKESRVVGFIPTAWYPSAVAISPDGKKLFVGVGKGLYSRANDPSESAKSITDNSKTPYDYIGRVLNGAVSVVDIPGAAQLATYTNEVVANRPNPQATIDQAEADRIQKNAFSKIKHVLYIIRENRTYDQVFG
ncbi:MAG TPA: beta-propeller fold lactonase family protein, partial [Blastocatellia bacterium]